MKSLHRPDLWGWSSFDRTRNLDFNSVLWVREGGNVLVDPLPMSTHDLEHLRALGGAAHVVITNSEHVRAAGELAPALGARLWGPAGERASFPVQCERWLDQDDVVIEGLTAWAMRGSKTPGELALVLEGTTLITGDLIRGQAAGRLNLLPDSKLKDRPAAVESVRALSRALPRLDAVLVGDGWPVFRDGGARLTELLEKLET